jgi:hypothetical protein
MVIESRTTEFNRALENATAKGIKRAAIHLHTECRKAVNEPNTGETRIRVRDTTAQGGGPPGSQYTVYEKPSQPGEPPHKITGTGQSNIVWETNDDPNAPAARVGVTPGGIHLDGMLGKHLSTIAKLAATGGKEAFDG